MSVFAPPSTFEFDPAAAAQAGVLLTAEPVALYRRLLRDQESEPALLVARRVLHGFLARRIQVDGRPPADPDQIAARVDRFRDVIVAVLEDLRTADPAVRQTVLRQRAPLTLLGGCWLDAVSQPAIQRSTAVDRLVRHQLVWQGRGNPRRGRHHLRRRALKAAGVHLPEILATDFMDQTEARPLTALHGAFYLSLAKLPANFLPEVIGVHYAVTALGVDDLLLGMPPMLPEPELRALLTDYLIGTGSDSEIGDRVVRAVELALAMELEHACMLAGLAVSRGGNAAAEPANRIGDRESAVWQGMLTLGPPADLVLRRVDVPDDRQFLHRLVHIENYPNTIDVAREHATVLLDIAEEVLFEHGGIGVLTDASWFDYSPHDLRRRVERICQDALGYDAGPKRRPDVLAGLTAGALTHRIGNVGRYTRRSAGRLYACQANELGHGVRGVGSGAPPEPPSHRYGLAIQALCLSLFPDTFYDEILGFNLGVTMLGLGRTTTPTPRRATRSAEIIVGYLTDLATTRGALAVRDHWRRIWRGYASFAFLVEPEPLGTIPGPAWPSVPTPAGRNRHSLPVS